MKYDLNNLINYLAKELKNNKKRKRDEILHDLSFSKKCEMIKSNLRILCYEKAASFLKKFMEKNQSTRQIGIYIKNLINMFEAQLHILKESETDANYMNMLEPCLKDKYQRYTTISISLIIIEILNDLKLQNYNKKINLLNYIKKKLQNENITFLKIAFSSKKIEQYFLKETLNDNKNDNKNNNKNDNYENKSDYESSDEEPINKKQKTIKFTKEGYLKDNFVVDDKNAEDDENEENAEDDENEENAEDDENDDDFILDELIKPSKTYKGINKLFMEELNKSSELNNNPIEESLEYFCNLEKKERQNYLDKIKHINKVNNTLEPSIIKIINMDITDKSKHFIINQLNNLAKSRNESGKLKTWVANVMKLPLGINVGINLDTLNTPEKIQNFLNDLTDKMNSAVYGHEEAKRKIVQLTAQSISNPDSKGGVLGIWGPPGNGKCFALNTPILMYNGKIKKVQDIVVGDIIMGDDSKPRNILSLGSGIDDMYEIIYNNGESYTVNSEHILCLKNEENEIIEMSKEFESSKKDKKDDDKKKTTTNK